MNSYEEILKRMKEEYKELSGYEVPHLSDIDIRLKILAGEIYKEQVNLEFIKNQMFVQTATEEYLDYHGVERGIVRKAAVSATGKVTFSVLEPLTTDLVIPKNTIVSTSTNNPLRFYTNNIAYITAGKKEVTVNCTAEISGADSNVVAGAINVLITSIPGINAVTNTYAFVGGADKETDEQLRKRIINSYKSISNGTNQAFYESLAMSIEGVTSVSVVPRAIGTGTVGVYISSNGDKPDDALVAKVQSVMNEEREINVDVRVIGASKYLASLSVNIKVLEGYNFNDVALKVKDSIREYVSSLEIGQSLYENYVGKVILGVEGVDNYEFTGYYDSEYIIEKNQFITINDIVIEELT